MKNEISAASWFLVQASKLKEEEMILLQKEISSRMTEKYTDHWYPQQPDRGSAYRVITISSRYSDPIVLDSADACGIANFPSLIKNPLHLFVNPYHVSVQYCDNNFSKVLYSAPLPTDLEKTFPSCKRNPTKKMLLHLSDSPSFVINTSPQKNMTPIYLTPSAPVFYPNANKLVNNF